MKKIFSHFFVACVAFLILALLGTCSSASSEEASGEEDASRKPAAEELEIPYSRGPTEPPSISAPKTKPPQ